MDLIKTPADGSAYLCDAAIATEPFLEATLGSPLDLDIAPDWDDDPKIPEAAGFPGYVKLYRDNVYNSEQDFTAIFTFTVYGPADCGDWLFADDLIVAVCLHYGGDARGNYGGPQFYRASNLAECGFLDWKLGFSVFALDGENLDEDGRYGRGYSSCPTTALEDALDGPGYWYGGEYHATLDGDRVVVAPDLYVEGQ